MGAILHVGTVIEGSAEFKSNRMSRKERKQSVTEEIMADGAIKGYTKRKYEGIQESNSRKRGRKGNQKQKSSRKNGMGHR